MIRTSYELNGYGSLIKTLVEFYDPKNIIEFGILDGYSLDAICKGASKEASIRAYDIFDDYEFKHGSRKSLEIKFPGIVRYGDFYCQHKYLQDKSIDFLHIDISNTGDIYQYVFDYYIPKVSSNGIILLEGGSKERDHCDWMLQYSCAPIKPVLERSGLNYFTFESFPSLTIVKANE